MLRNDAGEVGKVQMVQGQARGSKSVTVKSYFQVFGVNQVTLIKIQRMDKTGAGQEPGRPVIKVLERDAEGKRMGLRGETIKKVDH